MPVSYSQTELGSFLCILQCLLDFGLTTKTYFMAEKFVSDSFLLDTNQGFIKIGPEHNKLNKSHSSPHFFSGNYLGLVPTLLISDFISVHTGETTCMFCNKVLSRVPELKHHLRTRHNYIAEEQPQ